MKRLLNRWLPLLLAAAVLLGCLPGALAEKEQHVSKEELLLHLSQSLVNSRKNKVSAPAPAAGPTAKGASDKGTSDRQKVPEGATKTDLMVHLLNQVAGEEVFEEPEVFKEMAAAKAAEEAAAAEAAPEAAEAGELLFETAADGVKVTASLLRSPSTAVASKADVVFVVDSTGSMGDEISNVKDNLSGFSETLNKASVDYRIAMVEYKDITVSGEEHSTKVLTDADGRVWFTSPEEVAAVLSGIAVSGGGDGPETAVNALGLTLSDLDFRKDAAKFAILVTDADYKEDNGYGYKNTADLIAALKEKELYTSVISKNDYEPAYHGLYRETGGIFCDIDGDFAEELAKLAEHIKMISKAAKVSAGSRQTSWSSTEAQYLLVVKVESTDDRNTARNVQVRLIAPDEFNVSGSPVQFIGDLLPENRDSQSKTAQWNVTVPVLNEDKTYTWSAEVESRDFAIGARITAQDTFQVVGSGSRDYTWIFGDPANPVEGDNYHFFNTSSAFGSSIYISDEDMDALLSQLDNRDLEQLSWYYGLRESDPSMTDENKMKIRVENFRNNRLKPWEGSCHGMSLSALLFKVHLLDVGAFEDGSGGTADFTYDIAEITSASDSDIESMVNMHHVTWGLDVQREKMVMATHSAADSNTLWERANNIGKKDNREQPFILYFAEWFKDAAGEWVQNGAHSVVCYGAETAGSGTAWEIDGNTYPKRLKIADPNAAGETYLYLSSANEPLLYSAEHSYNYFYFYDASLSDMNKYGFKDTKTNYDYRIDADSQTDLLLSVGDAKAVIIAGKLVSADESLDISGMKEPGILIEDPVDTSGNCLYTISGGSGITVSPTAEGREMEGLITLGSYSASLTGSVGSMTLNEAGDILIEGAKGDISLHLGVDDSAFDLVTISGKADGTVSVSIKDGRLDISGDLTDYCVDNFGLTRKESEEEAEGGHSARFVIEEGSVVGYYDKDGDGVYETKIRDSKPGPEPEPEPEPGVRNTVPLEHGPPGSGHPAADLAPGLGHGSALREGPL